MAKDKKSRRRLNLSDEWNSEPWGDTGQRRKVPLGAFSERAFLRKGDLTINKTLVRGGPGGKGNPV